MWYIGCFCRIYLNVKIPIKACVSFMFNIILFSFHMHSLKSKKPMKSRKEKTNLLFSIHSATKATKKEGLNQSFMKIGKQQNSFYNNFLYCWLNQMTKVFIHLRVLYFNKPHVTPELHPPVFLHEGGILVQSVRHMPFKGVTISSLFLWCCFGGEKERVIARVNWCSLHRIVQLS